MRLDLYLTQQGYCETRSKASQLIKNNKVKVNDRIITKNGFEVKETDKITVIENDVLEYVSRGGHKLEKAIEVFSIDMKDKVICDIGSSTGGFTDCALKHGAKKSYAVDVGTCQLHESLRKDPRVVVLENTNFRYIDKSIFHGEIDYYVCDVSFISIREILKTLLSFKEDFHILLLFKPQFEVGPGKLNKKGVVKSIDYLIDALLDFEAFLKDKKLTILNASYSPILGNKEGNMEFLFDIASKGKSKKMNYPELVKEALVNLNIKA